MPEEFIMASPRPVTFVFLRRFIPQQFGAICGNNNYQYSMHLHSGLLSRLSTSNPLDNKARLMANTSQAQDLKGIHCEMHGIAEQIKIMNEINFSLVKHLATNNPPPPIAPIPKDADRSRRSGDQDSHSRHSTNSTGEETKRRGRSPHRDDRTHKCRDKSTTQKIKDLDARIDAINTCTNATVTVDALIRVRQKNVYHFFTIHQKVGKSLKDYVKCFNQAILEVEDPSDKVVVMAMMKELEGKVAELRTREQHAIKELRRMKEDRDAAVERLEKEVAELKYKEALAKKSAIEEYKSLDDFQEPDSRKEFTAQLPSLSQAVKRLTPELKERSDKGFDKGLCFRCDEKFRPGHKCKKLFVIEVYSPDEVEDDDGADEMAVETQAANHEETPKIYLHAIAGTRAPQTMQPKRWGYNRAKEGQFDVVVASGDKLFSGGKCRGIHKEFQGIPITVDLYVFPLEGYGAVLGAQWLRTLGLIMWDFSKLQMKFHISNKEVGLQGMSISADKLVGNIDITREAKMKKQGHHSSHPQQISLCYQYTPPAPLHTATSCVLSVIPQELHFSAPVFLSLATFSIYRPQSREDELMAELIRASILDHGEPPSATSSQPQQLSLTELCLIKKR
ncbi:hypothetical protein Acr_09g0005500 [Actinidia rufa]|uniref:Uncharacterized protein n=1 Tax=Actinidia rufa TaxID=165716 RepID=A0A7J0F5Y3_9ERIC|nr:hypothetical protein Acr_09g0005500 [Actinidia rufa]